MDVRNKKVTVVGLGQTAIALVSLLLREGARPFVTDAAETEAMRALRAQLDAWGVPYECGGHTDAAFEGAACVMPSPGVSPEIPMIRRAVQGGARLMGELEFASRHCRSTLLAVTGTNGKTTTTELLRATIAACGEPVALAGNNALPLSRAVQIEPAPKYMVVEVSSYALETATTFRPRVAAVLNVTPDHARHGGLDAYAAVKARLFAQMEAGDTAVVNADDPRVAAMGAGIKARVRAFSTSRRVDDGLWVEGDTIRDGGEAVASLADIPLPGRHNLANALAALTMARALDLDWRGVLQGLRGFPGVEHRIERVGELDGVVYYNDSKSTNLDSLKTALESFDRPLILIAGGRGKGADYRPLRELVEARVAHLVLIGEDTPLLEAAFGDRVPAHRAATLEEAVRRARDLAWPGAVVLLSPACASFDMFTNFEERGKMFKQCVLGLGERVTS